MKKNCRYAFIHSFRGKPWNEECQVAYNGFKKLGFECVLFTTNEEIAFRKRQDIVVGGILYAKFLYARWAELTGTVDECDF